MNAAEALTEPMPEDLLDAGFRATLTECFERLWDELKRRAPLSAAPAEAWIRRQNAPDTPESSFCRLKSHFLLMPRFLDLRIRGTVDAEFQKQLIYSSLNGYYFARLLDDVADGESPEDAPLLPMTAFFHYNFQRPYAACFPPGHPFWNCFEELWLGMADATVWAARTPRFAESDLRDATARRIAAVKIPVAAVCFRYGREDLLEGWLGFYDSFCCAHELLDDLCDCLSDLARGRSSFLLSQAGREKDEDEKIESYMIRAGLQRGYRWIAKSFEEAQMRAEALESDSLVKFICVWRNRVEGFWNSWEPELKQLQRLAQVFEDSSPVSG